MREPKPDPAERRRQQEARRQPDKDRTSHEAARGVKRQKQNAPRKRARMSLSKELSRRDPDEAEFDAATEELYAGSDRVAAIMGAALVENNLIGAIASCLPNDDDHHALFHDQSAPFGTFKAKIVAGRAMGLFNARVADDLDTIRDIRNQFAHALLSFDFSNPLIEGACNNLGEHAWRLADEGSRDISEARRRYERACWSISFSLLLKTNAKLRDKRKTLEEFMVEALAPAFETDASTADIATILKNRFKDR